MTYLIGEFSAMVGVSEHTLRFYEKEGLIKVDRNEHNVRLYSDENKLWIENLLHMKTTGMSLKDMKQFSVCHIKKRNIIFIISSGEQSLIGR